MVLDTSGETLMATGGSGHRGRGRFSVPHSDPAARGCISRAQGVKRYGTVTDQAEVSPDSKPSENITTSRTISPAMSELGGLDHS